MEMWGSNGIAEIASNSARRKRSCWIPHRRSNPHIPFCDRVASVHVYHLSHPWVDATLILLITLVVERVLNALSRGNEIGIRQ